MPTTCGAVVFPEFMMCLLTRVKRVLNPKAFAVFCAQEPRVQQPDDSLQLRLRGALKPSFSVRLADDPVGVATSVWAKSCINHVFANHFFPSLDFVIEVIIFRGHHVRPRLIKVEKLNDIYSDPFSCHR